MRLTDKRGQDIENFSNKMAETACQISGTGSSPIDLPTLVATASVHCEVVSFQLKDTGLHDLVDINPNSLSSNESIHTLKAKFWSLKAQVLWRISEGNKLDTKS